MENGSGSRRAVPASGRRGAASLGPPQAAGCSAEALAGIAAHSCPRCLLLRR